MTVCKVRIHPMYLRHREVWKGQWAVGVGGAFTKLPQALTRFAMATGSPDVTVGS